jgi:tetratricopeptide (TPR) repeat protein
MAMRPLLIGMVLLVMAGCARNRLPVAEPAPDVTARLAQSEALVRIGCFDCLVEALREYEAVLGMARVTPADVEAATVGAVRAALLLELRERELGTTDSGYRERARRLIGSRTDLQGRFALHLITIDSIPWRLTRFNVPTDPAELTRQQQLRANYASLLAERRATAEQDPLSAYSWLAFFCTHSSSREDRSRDALRAALPTLRDEPIVAYRLSTCIGTEPAPLTALLEQQPRFVEITYWLGQVALGRIQLEQAERLFSIAFQWRPEWPALTAALGNVYFTFEEPARALEYYDRTLALAPGHPDAILGRVKALSLLERHAEAIALVDEALRGDSRVFPGELYYWRAWNDVQTGELEQGWLDIQQADRLWVNSEVSKLGGIIAYRRRELEIAKERFRAAYKLAPEDCENSFYLGNVHAEQRDWPLTVAIFPIAARCVERGRETLRKEIAGIEASDWAPDRKARQIARREAQIAGAARMLAVSNFNTAAAHFNLGNREDARLYAERVADDEQFAERAREILKRLQ